MSGTEGGNAGAGDDYLTSKPFLEAKAYINSKGLPLTAENVRRFMAMKASNPGVGAAPQTAPQAPQAAPPSAQSGASTTSNQRGSAPDGLAQRMHQTAPQQQPQQPQQSMPQAQSDASQAMPQAASSSGGGNGGLLASLAALILGGGGAAYGASKFGGNGGNGSNVPSMPQSPLAGVNSVMQSSGGAAFPAASSLSPGPTEPVISGVNPIGPPQPGRIAPGPSSPVLSGINPIGPPQPTPFDMGPPTAPPTPQPPMPPGAAPASNVASHAPVSIMPRELGADAADLGGHMDWAKILGEISHVVRR